MTKFLNKKPFLIAEVSANHCGSIKIAKIKIAKKSGARCKTTNLYTRHDDY